MLRSPDQLGRPTIGKNLCIRGVVNFIDGSERTKVQRAKHNGQPQSFLLRFCGRGPLAQSLQIFPAFVCGTWNDAPTASLSRAHFTPLRKNPMKLATALLASAAVLFAAGASAQTPPAKDGPGNNAINTPGEKNSKAPVAGANSFTEGQAKSRIEDAGYTGVSDLKKDDNGVWRGKAAKGGTSSNVSIDFQGNVNAAR